jgi:hypothetical protein
VKLLFDSLYRGLPIGHMLVFDIGIEDQLRTFGGKKIANNDLDQQCIRLNESLWRVDQYETFLQERRQLLAQRAKKFLAI